MKLIELRLRNFRCYKNQISISFGDITALIGRNDAGKSTIMEALDIFFNDSSPDKHDASKPKAQFVLASNIRSISAYLSQRPPRALFYEYHTARLSLLPHTKNHTRNSL